MKIVDTVLLLSVKKKLFLLFCLALILRFFSYYTHPYIHNDAVVYLTINHFDSLGELETGLELYRQLPPSILYFMRIFTWLGVDTELGYRVTSIFLYSLSIFSFYYLSRQFISESASFFATFCFTCHPKIVAYSHAVMRESLAIPFILFGLSLLFLGFDKKKWIYLVLSGICIAISYMSRLEYGIAFLMGMAVYFVATLCNKKRDLTYKKECFFSYLYVLLAMSVLLFAAYLDMKKYNSDWDPLAFNKISGFITRTSK